MRFSLAPLGRFAVSVFFLLAACSGPTEHRPARLPAPEALLAKDRTVVIGHTRLQVPTILLFSDVSRSSLLVDSAVRGMLLRAITKGRSPLYAQGISIVMNAYGGLRDYAAGEFAVADVSTTFCQHLWREQEINRCKSGLYDGKHAFRPDQFWLLDRHYLLQSDVGLGSWLGGTVGIGDAARRILRQHIQPMIFCEKSSYGNRHTDLCTAVLPVNANLVAVWLPSGIDNSKADAARILAWVHQHTSTGKVVSHAGADDVSGKTDASARAMATRGNGEGYAAGTSPRQNARRDGQGMLSGATSAPAIASTAPDTLPLLPRMPSPMLAKGAEIVVVSGYRARKGSHGPVVRVEIDRPGHKVLLVLSSYEKVYWHVIASNGTTLTGVLMSGRDHSTVEASSGIQVYPVRLPFPNVVESHDFAMLLAHLHALFRIDAVDVFRGGYKLPGVVHIATLEPPSPVLTHAGWPAVPSASRYQFTLPTRDNVAVP